MATPAKQALQGSGAGWGRETRWCRGTPTGTTVRRVQSYQGAAKILAGTSVALPRAHSQRTAERAQRDDEWGLEALEEAIRTGEG